MAYIDGFDVDEDLFEELQTLAEEEGTSIEEVVIDILRDEFALSPGNEKEVEDDDDVEDDLDDDYISDYYDDEN